MSRGEILLLIMREAKAVVMLAKTQEREHKLIQLNDIIPYSLLRFEQLIEDYQYANGEEQKQ